MNNYNEINRLIQEREASRSFDDRTYYTIALFEHFCDHRDYKHVAIHGYYKSHYGWTNTQAQDMYSRAPDGWVDGVGVYRLYDWGRGANKIVRGADAEWHEPQLDHIVPRSRARALGWTASEIDSPGNFQVLPQLINRILTNLTDEMAPAVLPVLLAQFPNYRPVDTL